MNLQKNIEESYSHVYFLLRQGLYCRVQKYCDECYSQFQDPFFIFWKSFGLMKEKRVPEAINELQVIESKREIQFSVLNLLIQLHEQSQLVDEDQLDTIRFQCDNSKAAASDKAFLLAARQLTFCLKVEEAEHMLQQIHSQSKEVMVATGWVLFHKGDQQSLLTSVDKFKAVLQMQENHLEALLGLANVCQKLKKYSESLDTINEVIVYFDNNPTVYLEKALVLMAINDWDQCLDVIQQVLSTDSHNLIARKIQLFHQLAVEGDINSFQMGFSQYIQIMKEQESRNSEFMFEVSQMFSRLCGRNSSIVKMTQKLCEECRKVEPINCEYVVELGYQHILTGDYKAAQQFYQEAAALDETNMECLTGMIKCRIHQGELEDAENQIEFVNEIQLEGKSSEVAYLEAMLFNKRGKHVEAGKALDQALKLHIQMTKTLSPGFTFFIKLDPDYLIQLATQYQWQVSLNALLDRKCQESGQVNKGNKLLETVVKQVPGHLQAHLLLARGRLAVNDHHKAHDSLNKVSAIQNNNIDMYILNALLMFQQGNERTALSNLQQSIATNFQIRENILFLLIKGKIELQLQDYPGAIESLNEAVQVLMTQFSQKSQTEVFSFGEHERCLVYTNLAKAYGYNKQLDKAKEVINTAIGEFAGTEQEMNVLLANSQLAIEANDIKKALSILRAVGQDSIYYSQSRQLMGEVYLGHLKDRRNFTKCYTDLVETSPTLENYKLLGNAMISIQEPEEALAAFTNAKELSPNDQTVILAIGQSLTQGHYYQKAIAYYQDILQNHKKLEYILELGHLLMKTKRFNEAEKYLKIDNFTDEFNTLSLQDMKLMVEGLKSVHQLQVRKQGQDNYKSNPVAQQALEKAIQIQLEVVEKSKTQGVNPEQEKQELGWLYYQLAHQMHYFEKNSAVALACLDRAGKTLENNEKVMSLVVEIYWKSNEKQQCQQICQYLLKVCPNSDYGTFLYSELLIQKQEEKQAIEYFRNMFMNNTQNYRVLQRLIELESRFGDNEKVKLYIEVAEHSSSNLYEQGLCYCRGLFYKYRHESEKALVEFNKSKRASQYRDQSVYQMILLYLNPQHLLWLDLDEKRTIQVTREVIECCQVLLKELYDSTKMYQLLSCVIQIIDPATKSQDGPIRVLTELCKDNTEYIPALLFLSISKYVAGKHTESKNHLKILSKKHYSSEYHEELEMSWLLYADSFISISKFDNAEEILKKSMKYNRSCATAEEFMGLIKEKESCYIDAAQHYERAFLLTNSKSLSIGYRLAFNYLKAKRYIECCDICQKILKIAPDFPKVQKELLAVARQKIRM